MRGETDAMLKLFLDPLTSVRENWHSCFERLLRSGGGTTSGAAWDTDSSGSRCGRLLQHGKAVDPQIRVTDSHST